MNSVKITFDKRSNEVETYFLFVEEYTSNNNNELNKILKSNMILMLYNLVESSVANAIEAIYNNIHINNISFDELNIEFKKVLINQLKNNIDTNKFITGLNNIATEIIKKVFNKDKISAGNIDSRKIKDLGLKYGFSTTTEYQKTKSGKCLLEIKNQRNDLAHGISSFTEVGKNYSIEDLKKFKEETINYLNEILLNIETYLNQAQFKL